MRRTSRLMSIRSTAIRGAAALALAAGISAIASPAAACTQESYIGTVCTFAGNYCPKNWVKADGSFLSIDSYQPLYSLIGFTYGGDGKTAFAVPDLRGRASIGTGVGDPLTTIPIVQGQQIGTAKNVFIVPLPQHTHDSTLVLNTGTTQVTVPAVPSTLGVTASLPLATTATGTATKTPAPVAGNQNYIGATTASVKIGASSYPADITGQFSTSTTPPGGGASSPVTAGITGSPGNPEIRFDVSAPTGGTVTVAPAGTSSAEVKLSTQTPGLGMTTCIMTFGAWPDRP